MRTLVIECATEACSLALFEKSELLAHSHEVLGRGHAERLIPTIAGLPDQGRAERIVVSLGPGSFTGVRIGLAAARALSIAWNAPVVGYPTLAMVAANVLHSSDEPQSLTVCMTGGHGEYFIQNFGADGLPQDGIVSLEPDKSVSAAKHALVAGTQATNLVSLRGNGEALDLHPDARSLPSLPDAALTEEISPIYGRAPDAKLPKQAG